MIPQPDSHADRYLAAGKMKNKIAIITGGDSGIGRATAVAFAKEWASLAIVYLNENADAKDTRDMIANAGRDCIAIAGDIGNPEFCKRVIKDTMDKFGRIDVLVNNAAEQHPQNDIADITPEQLERTFRTNIFLMFYMVQAALPHLGEGAKIINTTSVTAYRGSSHLLDYASTKGAIVAFTRSLSQALAGKSIYVNAVAPGPIWTPLIPSTFDAEQVKKFGADVPLGRPGQPDEVAPSFVFLACDDSSYMTGQVLHPNGGEIINC